MLEIDCVLETDGKGYWSQQAKKVRCLGIEIDHILETGKTSSYSNSKLKFSELMLEFDQNEWTINKDGLIYTDPKFLEQFRKTLLDMGFIPGFNCEYKIDYSEQGMQGDTYVSFDLTADDYFYDRFRLLEKEKPVKNGEEQ